MLKLKKFMKVCIIGNNLSALLLSKVLVNKGIKVELCYEFNKKKQILKEIIQEQLVYQIVV